MVLGKPSTANCQAKESEVPIIDRTMIGFRPILQTNKFPVLSNKIKYHTHLSARIPNGNATIRPRETSQRQTAFQGNQSVVALTNDGLYKGEAAIKISQLGLYLVGFAKSLIWSALWNISIAQVVLDKSREGYVQQGTRGGQAKDNSGQPVD